jgi:hypothetical protein
MGNDAVLQSIVERRIGPSRFNIWSVFSLVGPGLSDNQLRLQLGASWNRLNIDFGEQVLGGGFACP